MTRSKPRTIGRRIAPIFEQRRKELDWSEKELGKRAGVTQPTVHRILNAEGENPRMENIEKLSIALGIQMSELLGIGTNEYRAIPSGDNFSVGSVRGRVPMISWVKAGEMCEAIDLDSPGYAEEWLDCPYPHSSNTFCLRIIGDSMFPEYREGELILVDPSLEAQHGDDVVVRIPDGKTTFKRLQVTPDGVHLLAMNKDFPNRIIEVPPDTHICGVVIASWTSRRNH
jgi:SOS-response transcriptional repressor LexA